MPVDRFFSTSTTITGKEVHHLRVTRKNVGDKIELIDGTGHLHRATLISIGKHEAKVTIDETVTEPPLQGRLVLAQSILSKERMHFVIEKGTELGVTEFWLFPADLSVKGVPPVEKLEDIAIAALKQSGRLHLPKILIKEHFRTWDVKLYYGHPDGTAPPHDAEIILIGPEKGFSDEELSWLEKSGTGISLGNYTLRAETAAIAAASYLAISKLV